MGVAPARDAINRAGALPQWPSPASASLLYETERYDPVTFGTVPLVLVAIALVACWLPAYRASRVESLAAMRAE